MGGAHSRRPSVKCRPASATLADGVAWASGDTLAASHPSTTRPDASVRHEERTMTTTHHRRARRLAAGGAVLLALLVPATTIAAGAAWTRQFGTTGEDVAGGIAADRVGVTVVGTTNGHLTRDVDGPSDAFIRRYDREGHVRWTRQFGTDAQDSAIDVAADGAGITVLGATDGSFTGGGGTPGIKDLFVRRYDRDGNVLWTRQFGTSVDEEPGAIAADATGIIVVGTTWGALRGTNTPDDADAIVRRYDRSGNVVFTRQFGTSSADSATAVAIDGAGFTVGGGTDGDLTRRNAGPFTDTFLRRYDAAGHVDWTRQWGRKGDDQVLSIAADGKGITSVGYTHADAQGEAPSQAFIRRHDRDGKLLWSKIFGSPDSEIAWGVAADHDALTVTGYTYGELDGRHRGSFDVFVRRYDRSGDLVWRRQFGTKGADLGLDVAADGAGFTVLGHTNGSLAGDAEGELDIFVRRFNR
jgi:hypothetical protein